MLKIPDRTQFEEVSILCPFRDPARSCGVQTGIDGRPHEYHGDNQLGGAKECETTMHEPGAY